jgi:hypothetical protein
VCLDHVLTNLPSSHVDNFTVLADNISDHRGLAVTLNLPRPRRGGGLAGEESRVCITGWGVGTAIPVNAVTPCEFAHEVAKVEVLPTDTSLFARAAWCYPFVLARLLMPGAVEFAGAVSQTQAFAALKTRLQGVGGGRAGGVCA